MDAQHLAARYGLDGLVAVVTGASDGLGAAVAQDLRAAGAAVHGLSRRGTAPTGVVGHAVDVADHATLARTFAGIGALDILVVNAGISARSAAATMEPEAWRRILAVNLDAAWATCRAAHPALRTSPAGGRVVAIASMAAHLGFREVAAYAASKAGLLGLCRTLAVEWAADGIRVNTVSPGWFRSGMNRAVVDADREARILARMPLRRYATVAEVAAAVVFLCTPAASYITGIDLAVDGGALAYGY